MKAAISQPTYLPWIGYFDLIDQVDQFVVLDNVQFAKQSWQQRNRIRTAAGLQWMTIPVEFRGRLGQQIREVKIRDVSCFEDHLRAVELAYRRAPFFSNYFPALRSHFESVRSGSMLAELNEALLRWLLATLGITTPMIVASQLSIGGKRTELLAAICRHLHAATYISPMGASAYLLSELEIMSAAGVEVLFQNYVHPEYRQLFPPFLPYASILDLLFNEGPKSLEIMRSGRREPLTPDQVSSQLAGGEVLR
jgi:hypothetical protein